MKNVIWAIYGHIICEECSLEEQHSKSPKEEGTWWKYWEDVLNGTST